MDAVVGHSNRQFLILNFDPSKSGGATALPAPMVVTLLVEDSIKGLCMRFFTTDKKHSNIQFCMHSAA